MAHVSSIATALASHQLHHGASKACGVDHGKFAHVDGFTPGDVVSNPPAAMALDMPGFATISASDHPSSKLHPSCQEMEARGQAIDVKDHTGDEALKPAGTPLSKGALSGLEASQKISPTMLAKYYLPGIMLGNGPRPIRHVMSELTQSVPGFSRMPPAKARRTVVAALEHPEGGGPDGSVMFNKTGWGRWDAHVKGSARDSGIGSFHDGGLSLPTSDRSGYAFSHGDSAVHMPGLHAPAGYREQHCGGSWTASSNREEGGFAMDLDVPENEAEKMSLDEPSDSSCSTNDDTDEEDWTAPGADALRKASLPPPGAPRTNYQALSIPGHGGRTACFGRAPSSFVRRSLSRAPPAPAPPRGGISLWSSPGIDPATATPEEKAAVDALMSLGSQ